MIKVKPFVAQMQFAKDEHDATDKFLTSKIKNSENRRKEMSELGMPIPSNMNDEQLVAAQQANGLKYRNSVMGIMMAQTEGQPSTTSQMPTEARGMRMPPREVHSQMPGMTPEVMQQMEMMRMRHGSQMDQQQEQQRIQQQMQQGVPPGYNNPEAEMRMRQQQSMRDNQGY